MIKYLFVFLLILPLFLFVFLAFSSITLAAVNCNGTLVKNCNASGNTLTGSYSIAAATDANGNSVPCNVFVRSSVDSAPLSNGRCEGNFEVKSNVLDGTTYQLVVSNGLSSTVTGGCLNEVVATASNVCNTQNPAGSTTPQATTPTGTTARTSTSTSTSGNACRDNPPGADLETPGLTWKADCSRSCSQQPPSESVCPWSKDEYILSKHSDDTTAWCYGFDGGAKCMQIKVKNPPGGKIECEGNPSCVYSGANPQVALNVSWQGLRECHDSGFAPQGVIPQGQPGGSCNYVGAELCVRDVGTEGWKLVAAGGSDPKGKTLFPDGFLPRVPPSGGIGWIQTGKNYEFALFETAYTCPDSACLAEQSKVRACKGKPITQKTVATGGVASGGSPTPIPTPTTKTAFYRLSTTPFNKNDASPAWKDYTDNVMSESLDFGTPAPGTPLAVYAQFKSTTGVLSNVISKSIAFVGPDPVIKTTRCGYSPTGAGTEVVIEGENFGQKGNKGKVSFNNQDAKISSWDLVATSSATSNAGSGPLWRIVASIKDKLQGSQPIPLRLETNDGRTAPVDRFETCTINLTTLSFNAKAECRATTDMSAENIKVQIKEKAKGAKPIFSQTINLNSEGQPVWTPPVLEVDKDYTFIARGPKTLGHRSDFKAKDGTNVLDEFRMLIGDIAPTSSPDNRVNTLDYGVLLGQWAVGKDVVKTADFNQDKRVNSIDYACMRQNFNKNGEDLPD